MRPVSIAIIVVLAVAVACAPAPARTDEAGRQLVEIRAWQWGFAPEVVRVRAGVPVRIRAESLDVAHSVTSEAMGLDLQVPAKGDGIGEIVFTPTKPGEYVIRCGVDCGPARSRMIMTMIVMMK